MPYGIADLPLFLLLPPLLALSFFFSASETGLFGLTAHQRFRMAQRGGLIGRTVERLLADQRLLLITLLIGNTTVNVSYFVVCSALLLKTDGAEHPLWTVLMSAAPLLVMVLGSELLPKMLANVIREQVVRALALPLYAVHRALRPVGRILGRWVVGPVGRVFAPRQKAGELTTDEMEALLDMSRTRGVIGSDEQQLLKQVLLLGQRKVRDVMVPRVDIIAIDVNEDPRKLQDLIEERPLMKYLAIDGDIDHVEGVIYTRQFLLARRIGQKVDLRSLVRKIRFVPELLRVDQLLEDFRKTGTHLALAVDEYGGTSGLTTLKDIVERMVGDLDMDGVIGDESLSTTQQVAPGVWRVGGRLSVHDWAEAFGAGRIPPRVATVGGLVAMLAGKVPQEGDRVRLGNVEMQVERMDGGRVESVLLRLMGSPRKPEAAP